MALPQGSGRVRAIPLSAKPRFVQKINVDAVGLIGLNAILATVVIGREP